MAELEDWTCEFGGLLMGAPDSAISIVGVDGLLSLPDVRTSDLALVQRHGLYAGDDYMNGRTVTLTIEVYGSTRVEFADAIAAVQSAFVPAGPESALRFRFPGVAADATAYVMVRPRRRSAPLDLNFANLVCNIVVELYSTSPYILGDEEVTETVVSDPDEDPVTVLTQIGAYPARPEIVITGATNPTLHNDTEGWGFAVIHTGTVVIDSLAETVTDGSGNDLSSQVVFGSVWPEFKYGDHALRLVHDASDVATAVISWQNRWV